MIEVLLSPRAYKCSAWWGCKTSQMKSNKIQYASINLLPLHPRPGHGGQQSKQRNPDFLLPGPFFQLFCRDGLALLSCGKNYFAHYLTCEQDPNILQIIHLREGMSSNLEGSRTMVSDLEVLILSFHTWLQTAPVHAECGGSKEPTKTTLKDNLQAPCAVDLVQCSTAGMIIRTRQFRMQCIHFHTIKSKKHLLLIFLFGQTGWIWTKEKKRRENRKSKDKTSCTWQVVQCHLLLWHVFDCVFILVFIF